MGFKISLMIDLERDEELANVAKNRMRFGGETIDEYHVTVAFWRRAPESLARQLIKDREILLDMLPNLVQLTGELELFGSYSTLVALVNPSCEFLSAMREFSELTSVVAPDSKFRPHVTIGRGPFSRTDKFSPLTIPTTGIVVKMGSIRRLILRRDLV